MVQDILEKFDLEYKDILPTENDYVLYYKDNGVLLINDKLPKYDKNIFEDLHYLFKIGNNKYFISFIYKDNEKLTDMFLIRSHNDHVERFAIFTGNHLNEWYKKTKYCGECGKITFYDNKERAKRCECGNIIYPRINPAVIVAITSEDEILLTKYKNGTRYVLVAGYTEIGETFEDTVKREVFEEVGLNVKNITYYKSQPWGLSGSILAGYFCEVDGSKSFDIAEDELKEAKWFKKNELEPFDNSLSLTNTLIEEFRTRK